MAVAEAAASHHQLVHGVVVFLQHVGTPVQQVVPQGVQLDESDAQVGDPEKICGRWGVSGDIERVGPACKYTIGV